MLSEKEEQEFKRIARETMQLDLTDAEAQEQGSRLVTLFELLIKIDRKNIHKREEKDES